MSFWIRIFKNICHFKLETIMYICKQPPVVNLINILGTNILYTSALPAFYYSHVAREKLLERLLYKKGAHKMLIKLTPIPTWVFLKIWFQRIAIFCISLMQLKCRMITLECISFIIFSLFLFTFNKFWNFTFQTSTGQAVPTLCGANTGQHSKKI